MKKENKNFEEQATVFPLDLFSSDDEKDKEVAFADKSVTYDKFLDELAIRLAVRLNLVKKSNGVISQNQAYRMFGRADVERWIKSGKLKPARISPGKIRYNIVDLCKLSKIKQNYLIK